MIEQLIVVVLCVEIVFLVGMLFGQHSVWRSLRKKGDITIDEWHYTAARIIEE